MQTIARANRVYDDEKENGLIVDYGNVYQQLEKAYAIYGEGQKGSGGEKGNEEKPFEQLEAMASEVKNAIVEVTDMLSELDFDLKTLIEASAMSKIAAINNGINAICRNEETKAKFEIAARNVFRKYKALFPEKQAKQFVREYNAIDALYSKLNAKVKSADVTEVITRLQSVVNESISIVGAKETEGVYIDLSKFNIQALQEAFAKIPRKNELVYDLNKAVENKLEQMLKENPLRLEFYERYQEIVEEYNNGKSEIELKRSFDKLTQFYQELTVEEKRAFQENLDQPTLSIFDLLVKGKDLTKDENETVKKVAQETLEILQREKLNILNWKESREIRSSVKTTIYDKLLWLPEEKYTDEDVSLRSILVYQHVYSNMGFNQLRG
nr:hypothetical protein [Sphingobacterium hotanense]